MTELQRQREEDKQDQKPKRLTEELLENLWPHLDAVGRALMGSLWRDVYETVQDAIALAKINRLTFPSPLPVDSGDYRHKSSGY